MIHRQSVGVKRAGESAIRSQALEKCQPIMNGYATASARNDVDDLYFLYSRSTDWSKGGRSVTCIALTTPSRSGSLKG
jgi:hypothetical protein